jgi:surface antigen
MAFFTTKMLRVSARNMFLGASLALSALAVNPALAASTHSTHSTLHGTHNGARSYHHTAYHHYTHHTGTAHVTNMSYQEDGFAPRATAGHRHHYRHARYAHYAHYHSGLQCVPYAREISHISLSGNAFLWWAEASGRYARGNTPEQNAVLNFRAIGRMPLGHVAVVTAVLDNRTILVTQANWVRGTITNDVTVQDVSPNNDWTQVKVELGDTTTTGASYPTYGFIYNRPDTGVVIAANNQGTEVAEAPAVVQVSADAPNRNLQ